MQDYIDNWIFSFRGMEFRAYMVEDNTDRYPPWKEYEFHGIISEWESRDKKPGERILAEDLGSRMFYDVQSTMRKALAEEWGIAPDRIEEWAQRIGKQPTARQIAAAAVEDDFRRMRAWCADEWHYVGICVCRVDDEGEDIGEPYEHALWGIESDSGREYFQEIANDLADDLSEESRRHGARVSSVEFAAEFGEC